MIRIYSSHAKSYYFLVLSYTSNTNKVVSESFEAQHAFCGMSRVILPWLVGLPCKRFAGHEKDRYELYTGHSRNEIHNGPKLPTPSRRIDGDCIFWVRFLVKPQKIRGRIVVVRVPRRYYCNSSRIGSLFPLSNTFRCHHRRQCCKKWKRGIVIPTVRFVPIYFFSSPKNLPTRISTPSPQKFKLCFIVLFLFLFVFMPIESFGWRKSWLPACTFRENRPRPDRNRDPLRVPGT